MDGRERPHLRSNPRIHRSHDALRDVNRKRRCVFVFFMAENHKRFIVPAESHVGLKHSVLVGLVKSST